MRFKIKLLHKKEKVQLKWIKEETKIMIMLYRFFLKLLILLKPNWNRIQY